MRLYDYRKKVEATDNITDNRDIENIEDMVILSAI